MDILPSSNGVPTGLKRAERERERVGSQQQSEGPKHQHPEVDHSQESREELGYRLTHPKITAFHSIILFSDGAPLTPVGGSS